ncbi:hypothetical protein JTE90_027539 [Oedothorax gibbosus]|uniref:Carboxylesterase type B domain-containing protein n=1 Tax=Oedothorax gibbosus TaxID=931172 RepID=A0AAV6VK12_9ARAC|nr:hypothetical protein JTE90_027539 [Oedothorax gibbosus]
MAQSIRMDDVVPNEYDNLLPPIRQKGVPVNVSVSLFVLQMHSLDEIEMNFKMDFVMRQLWEDDRLIFPQSLKGLRDKVVLDSTWGSNIWTPDVWFKNALNVKLQEWINPSVFYWFMSNKTVLFSGRVTLELSCDMNMAKYPHDVQFCGVTILSLMNPSTDVSLHWMPQRPIRLSKIMNLPQFDVNNFSLSRCDTDMYEEKFSCIRVSFSLIRRGGYFMINIYVPTVLIVAMSMLTFWIPPEAVPARITLGVTSLLTIITKQYQSNMPNVSYVVALNVWLSSCIAFVFCSLLEYAVVVSLMKNQSSVIKPVDTDGVNDDEKNKFRKFLKGAWIREKWYQVSPHALDFVSRILFPAAFALFSIIYAFCVFKEANMIAVQLLLITCGTILCLLQQVITSPSVKINGHQIIGKEVSLEGRYVNEYLGIPYAEPPVGPLRFQKPQTFQNYPPVFEATTNPPACPQFIKQPPRFAINITDTSEDCLYLNIWTPSDAGPANKKAVLFWIHGGGFRIESIRKELYTGTALVSQGDIIVVTVNYRLGLFGFLTTGTEDAPANRGLYDILEGLKWVNKKIEAFGGDTQRITISGESVGAISVGFLTISPLAQGLYTRLIMESGSPLRNTNGQTTNPINAQKIAEAVECANETYAVSQHPKEVVECLRGLDAEDLLRAEEQLFPKIPIVGFIPQFGDELLPNDPQTAVFHTNFNCKDLFFGFNKDEGSLRLTLSQPELYGLFGEKNPPLNKTFGRDEIRTFLNKSFPQSPVDFEAILQHYFPVCLAENDSVATRHQIYTAQGDIVTVCPQKFYGEKCSELEHNVYAYFFTHRPSVTELAEWAGATHYDEVQFVFGQPLLNPEKYKESEVTLSRQMIDIWSNFVKTGIPDSSWPLYSKENPSFKYFGPETFTGQIGSSIHFKSCNLLRPLYGAD